MRVLIVEDSAILALDLKDELAEAGHEVVAVAGSVGQADLVAAEAIDVAIVDVKLPDGSGYELARRLSRRGTRIVFASAGLASDVPSDLAAWPFLAKPYLTDSVRAALKAA